MTHSIEILIDPDAEVPLRKTGITEDDVRAAVLAAARLGECDDVEVGVRVTMDAAIHAINRQFLQHDYPTDVISFPYELAPPTVEGELVVSVETGLTQAREAGWSAKEEVLLYVIHGTLHLVGFDDTAAEVRSAMRNAEHAVLRSLGMNSPKDDSVQ